MVIPKTKWYSCRTCKLEMIPEREVTHITELTLSGHIVQVTIHKKCGEQAEEFEWRKH